MIRFIDIAAVSALLLLPASPVSAQTAQAPAPAGEDGELLFNNACRTCHTLKEGDNRLGPNLHAVIGRKAGSLPDYAYSPAMAAAGIVWDEETLSRFIEDPAAVVPGNTMGYPGLPDAEQRAKIVAYLKTAGGN